MQREASLRSFSSNVTAAERPTWSFVIARIVGRLSFIADEQLATDGGRAVSITTTTTTPGYRSVSAAGLGHDVTRYAKRASRSHCYFASTQLDAERNGDDSFRRRTAAARFGDE